MTVTPAANEVALLQDAAGLVPPQRTTPALLMSLSLHLVLLTSIGLLAGRTPHGSAAVEERQVGIALVERMPDRDRYVDAAEVVAMEAAQTEAEASASSAAAVPPPDLAFPIDLAGVLRSMQSTPTPVAGSGLAGQAELDGAAFAPGTGAAQAGDAKETTTVLFGISGSGSRFVYVFDRSDSMNGFGGKPLRAAKAELIRSLKTLTDRQRFQIIFYNDKPKPFELSGAPLQLLPGEPGYLSEAERFVTAVVAFGGTEHEGALKLALRMSPDVIFFLTDARIPRLSSTELREIKSRAESIGATIHAIEFGAEPAPPQDSFLRELAAQNSGQYRYINVHGLSPDRSLNADLGAEPASPQPPRSELP
jgi:hypothetical protein